MGRTRRGYLIAATAVRSAFGQSRDSACTHRVICEPGRRKRHSRQRLTVVGSEGMTRRIFQGGQRRGREAIALAEKTLLGGLVPVRLVHDEAGTRRHRWRRTHEH